MISVGVIIILLGTLFVGGIVGLEYFQDEFTVFRAQVKSVVQEGRLLTDEEVVALTAVESVVAEGEIVEEVETDIRTIDVNGETMDIDVLLSTMTWFDAGLMTTEQTNVITFGDFSGYEVYFEGEAVSEGDTVEVELEYLSVASGLELTLVSEETGKVKYYYIRTLYSGFSSVTEGEGEGDGYYYYTSNDAMYKMDTSGNVVFFKVGNGMVRDFKQTIIDDVVYYSYLQTSETADNTVAASTHEAIVMNADYEVIDTISSLSTEQGLAENIGLDSHEFVILGENHYLIDSYVYKDVDNVPTDISEDGTAYIQASVVQEIKDGELLFQWDSTEYPELYGYSIREERIGQTDEGTYVDYVHYNSIDVDPDDNNFILSFRSLNAVLKIDRETGDIIWILGGEGDDFGLTDEQKMSEQHYARYYDSDLITVFDNGVSGAQTKALEYVLDEENLTVVEFNAYEIEGYYSGSKGSAQKVSDDSATYVMGWGETSANNIVFTEVNFDTGEILFQMMDLDCVDDYHATSYRVYKFDS